MSFTWCARGSARNGKSVLRSCLPALTYRVSTSVGLDPFHGRSEFSLHATLLSHARGVRADQPMAARHGCMEMLSHRPSSYKLSCIAFHHVHSPAGTSCRTSSAHAEPKLNGTAVDRGIGSMPARPRLPEACERGLPDVDACTIDFVRLAQVPVQSWPHMQRCADKTQCNAPC